VTVTPPPDHPPTPLQRLVSKVGARSNLAKAATLGLAFVLLYAVGTCLPPGYDWRLYWSHGLFPPWFVPWTKPIVGILNLPAIFALTIIGIALRSLRNSSSPLPLALAVVSLPTLWVLFLGDFTGLTLIGLLLLPWGVPLVLLKPQVAAFALLARGCWFFAAMAWLALSLVAWGMWPLKLTLLLSDQARGLYPQDITLFPWGLLVAIPLMWLSRGDDDLLMAAGSLGTPHLFPYHFISLMPALARMRVSWMIATWLLAWTPLLANWLGPTAWHLGNLVSLSFWLGIYLNRKRARLTPVNNSRLHLVLLVFLNSSSVTTLAKSERSEASGA
jgi:hypothetical protein